MQPEDQIRIGHMRDATSSVVRFVAGRRREDLDADEMLRFALIHAIEVIGEAARSLSDMGTKPG